MLLRYAATGSATLALLCAALNSIALAGLFLVAAIAALLLHLLQIAYRRLPEADRAALLSRRAVRSTAVISLLAAIGVSCVYWYAMWLPLDRQASPMVLMLSHHWQKLDFIPALFAQLLPSSLRSPFHQYVGDNMTYCFPGPYWWESMRFLRAAIPGYFVAFFAAILAGRLGAALVRRRA